MNNDDMGNMMFQAVWYKFFEEDVAKINALPVEQRPAFIQKLREQGRYTLVREGV